EWVESERARAASAEWTGFLNEHRIEWSLPTPCLRQPVVRTTWCRCDVGSREGPCDRGSPASIPLNGSLAVRALSFADNRGPDIAVRVAPQGEPELVLQANEFKPKRDVFTVRPDDWGSPWLSVQDLSCVHATTCCKLLAIFREREMTRKPRRKAILRTVGFDEFPEKNDLTPDPTSCEF